jgi:hypothetical protein
MVSVEINGNIEEPTTVLRQLDELNSELDEVSKTIAKLYEQGLEADVTVDAENIDKDKEVLSVKITEVKN